MSFIILFPLELTYQISSYCLYPLSPLLQVCKAWRDFYTQASYRHEILRSSLESIPLLELEEKIESILLANRRSRSSIDTLEACLSLTPRDEAFALSSPYERVLRRYRPLPYNDLLQYGAYEEFRSLRCALEGKLLSGDLTDSQWQRFFDIFFAKELEIEAVMFLIGSGLLYRLNRQQLIDAYVLSLCEGDTPDKRLLACILYPDTQGEHHLWVRQGRWRIRSRGCSLAGTSVHPLTVFSVALIRELFGEVEALSSFRGAQECDDCKWAVEYIECYVRVLIPSTTFNCHDLAYQSLAYLLELVYNGTTYLIQGDSLEFLQGLLLVRPESYHVFSCRSKMEVSLEPLSIDHCMS